jgi:hypothetical protein
VSGANFEHLPVPYTLGCYNVIKVTEFREDSFADILLSKPGMRRGERHAAATFLHGSATFLVQAGMDQLRRITGQTEIWVFGVALTGNAQIGNIDIIGTNF